MEDPVKKQVQIRYTIGKKKKDITGKPDKRITVFQQQQQQSDTSIISPLQPLMPDRTSGKKIILNSSALKCNLNLTDGSTPSSLNETD